MKGWSQPWIDDGHEVLTVDIQKYYNPTIVIDILDLDINLLVDFKPDIILASPPCEKFSVLRIGSNWTLQDKPRNDETRHAVKVVERTKEIIEQCNPMFFIIENPMGKLRKLPILADYERRMVTYCQYGENRRKPTDLWGGFPKNLVLKEPCKNGDSCHMHVIKGSNTGTVALHRAKSAKIPRALSLAIKDAAEREYDDAKRTTAQGRD